MKRRDQLQREKDDPKFIHNEVASVVSKWISLGQRRTSKYLQYKFGVSSRISPTRLIRCFLLSKQRRNWSCHDEQRVGPEVVMRFATWTTLFAKSSLTNGWWTWGSRCLKPPLQPEFKNRRKMVRNQGSNGINVQWRTLSSTRSRSARRHTDLATCNDDAAAQTWLHHHNHN